MLGMVGVGGVSGGEAGGGFGVPNNVYGVVLSDSTINIAADTFDLTADGTGIVFATQSVNQMPGQQQYVNTMQKHFQPAAKQAKAVGLPPLATAR